VGGRGCPANSHRRPWDRWDELEVLRARGVAALFAHEPERAAGALGEVWEHTLREGVADPGAFPVAGDLVEALVWLGRIAEADAVTAHLRDLAERQEHPWALATVSRCAAMARLAAGYDESSAARLADAAASYGELGLRFDRARSLLWLGRAARRARKRTAARQALETAGAEFDALGSPGWAGQARAELDLLGARAAAAGSLTAAEQRVAELAASGLSNKQIARRLFVAVHTVEVHLAHAYAKLGVHSRAQLASRLASSAPPQATPAPQDTPAPREPTPARRPRRPRGSPRRRRRPRQPRGSPRRPRRPRQPRPKPDQPRRKPRIEGFRYRAGRLVLGSLLDMTETWTRLRGRARHLAPVLTIPLLLAGTAASIGPAAASAAMPTAACSASSGPSAWGGPPPVSPGTEDNGFFGVTVLSPCDAWAVGFDQNAGGLEQTLIENWDGTAWTVVPSPNVAGLNNQLTAVRAGSPTDIWAVGESFATGTDQPLILHWGGGTWTRVASPNPGGRAYLEAVRVVSPTDAWAVGSFANTTFGSLILHWNGHKWAQVASPHPGTNSALYGVAATSASNAWAVGTFFNGTTSQGFILHWNGQKWASKPSPIPVGPPASHASTQSRPAPPAGRPGRSAAISTARSTGH